MGILRIEERTGIASRADAEAFRDFAEMNGWTASIVAEPDGTFTLRMEKEFPAAETPPTEVPELSEGEPAVDGDAFATRLLSFIASHESDGNYNAHFGRAGNTNNPKFTSMLLKSVLDWQTRFVNDNGSPSSAVGRYQIIHNTMRGLIEALALDVDQVRFNGETQDKMALKLLEGRGYAKYRSGTLGVEDFATELAKEWAALPVLKSVQGQKRMVARGQSFYAGDGLNKALASADEIEALLRNA